MAHAARVPVRRHEAVGQITGNARTFLHMESIISLEPARHAAQPTGTFLRGCQPAFAGLLPYRTGAVKTMVPMSRRIFSAIGHFPHVEHSKFTPKQHYPILADNILFKPFISDIIRILLFSVAQLYD